MCWCWQMITPWLRRPECKGNYDQYNLPGDGHTDIRETSRFTLIFNSHKESLSCDSCFTRLSFSPPSLWPSCSVFPSTQSSSQQSSPTFCTTFYDCGSSKATELTVVIPAHTLVEFGRLAFARQLLSKSKSPGSFTSMRKISLELWAWTFGCWIFTATVLPSCSTALCTWASDAAPKGVSSKLTKSSFICQEKGKRYERGVPETTRKESLDHWSETACTKSAQAQIHYHSYVPCPPFSLLGLPVKPAKQGSALRDGLLMETSVRVPAAHFI